MEWGKNIIIESNNESEPIKGVLYRNKELETFLYNDKPLLCSPDPLQVFNNTVFSTNYKQMSLLIDLAFNNSYSEYFKEILSGTSAYEPYVKSFNLEGLRLNLLKHTIFATFNLKPFLSSIENRGYIINQGPQK